MSRGATGSTGLGRFDSIPATSSGASRATSSVQPESCDSPQFHLVSKDARTEQFVLVSLLLLRTALHDPKEHDIQGSCCSSSRTPSTPALRLSSRCTPRRRRPAQSAARLQARGLTSRTCPVCAGARGAISSCSWSARRPAAALLLVLLVLVLTYCGSCSCCSRSRCSSSRSRCSSSRSRSRCSSSRLLELPARPRGVAPLSAAASARSSSAAADARVAARGVGAATAGVVGGPTPLTDWAPNFAPAASCVRRGAQPPGSSRRRPRRRRRRRRHQPSSSAPTPQFVRDGAALVGPRVVAAPPPPRSTSRRASRGWRGTAAPPGRPPPLPPAAVTAALLGKPSARATSSAAAARHGRLTLPEGLSDVQCSECDASFIADVPPPQVAAAGGRRRREPRGAAARRCAAHCGVQPLLQLHLPDGEGERRRRRRRPGAGWRRLAGAAVVEAPFAGQSAVDALGPTVDAHGGGGAAARRRQRVVGGRDRAADTLWDGRRRDYKCVERIRPTRGAEPQPKRPKRPSTADSTSKPAGSCT